MGPTSYESTITKVDHGSPTRCGILILDQVNPVTSQRLSTSALPFTSNPPPRSKCNKTVGQMSPTPSKSITAMVDQQCPTRSPDLIWNHVGHGVPQPPIVNSVDDALGLDFYESDLIHSIFEDS